MVPLPAENLRRLPLRAVRYVGLGGAQIDQVPAYRSALLEMMDFAIHQDFGSSVDVSPLEGSGVTRQFFTAHRLCGGRDDLTDETWTPLREHPPKEPAPDRRDAMIAWADNLSAQNPDELTTQLRALRAKVAVEAHELTGAPPDGDSKTLQRMPRASLWLVSVDDVLLARCSFCAHSSRSP